MLENEVAVQADAACFRYERHKMIWLLAPSTSVVFCCLVSPCAKLTSTKIESTHTLRIGLTRTS